MRTARVAAILVLTSLLVGIGVRLARAQQDPPPIFRVYTTDGPGERPGFFRVIDTQLKNVCYLTREAMTCLPLR